MFTIVLVCLFGLAVSTDCPNRWTAYEGSCYLFGHDDVHFTEAEEYCRHHSAHLVNVNSKQENMFLKDYIRDLKAANYYLGMTDEEVEGIWKWYDTNTVVNFTDWGPTEPQNGGGNEDCAAFHQSYDFQWADISCVSGARALCEIRSEGSSEVVG